MMNYITRTLFVLVLSLSMTQPAQATELNASLEELKLAYLFNISKFVNWPVASTQTASANLNLCVNDDELIANLTGLVKGRSSQGKALQLLNPGKDAAAISSKCHLFFVSSAGTPMSRQLLDELHASPVMLVSDGDYYDGHAVIRLLQQGDKLRFIVNQTVAGEKGLDISSKLLSLAISVR